MLVGEGLHCKITDFGMARDLGKDKIYVRRSNVSKHLTTYRFGECALLPTTPLSRDLSNSLLLRLDHIDPGVSGLRNLKKTLLTTELTKHLFWFYTEGD